jgi:hypothetical protein
VLIKVDDINQAHGAAEAAGLTPSALETGPHEVRFVVEGSGTPATMYSGR